VYDTVTHLSIVPGALRMSPEELEQRSSEIPRDRDVVLYCSCPDEAAAARAALRLKRRGIPRVRPLAAGFPRGGRRDTRWRVAVRLFQNIAPRQVILSSQARRTCFWVSNSRSFAARAFRALRSG